MTIDQIQNIIAGYLTDALKGLDKENPKLDFKTKWYNLKDEISINEFLKDCTSIANTPGLDGFIVIGYDEKKKAFHSAKFSDCSLKDSNELVGLIISRVDRIFHIANYDIDIDGNNLSILHIPPSFDKPHVIKKYKTAKKEEDQRVFIRYGSTTRIATKYDYDFINYDRKNNIPEYSLYMSSSLMGYHPRKSVGSNHMDLDCGLTFENNGLRPIAINEILLTFYIYETSIQFISKTNKDARWNTIIKVSNILVHPMEIQNCSALGFSSVEEVSDATINFFQEHMQYTKSIKATVKMNNNRSLDVSVDII